MSWISKTKLIKCSLFFVLLLINSVTMALSTQLITFLVAPNESHIYTLEENPDDDFEGSKILRITELSTGRSIKKISVPLAQHFSSFRPTLAITPDEMKLYIADIDKRVYFVDLLTGEVTRIKNKPRQDSGHEVSSTMIITPDGRYLYIADGDAQLHSVALVHIIDTMTNKVVNTVPGDFGWRHGSIAMDSNLAYLYISRQIDFRNSEISVLDMRAQILEKASIKFKHDDINSIAMHPTNGLLYAAIDNNVSVIDPLKRTVIDKISIYTSGHLGSITFALNGEKFYLVNDTGGRDEGVISYNIITKKRYDILTTVSFALPSKSEIHASIDGTKIYVSDGFSNIVHIIDTNKDEIIQDLKISD